MRRRTVVLAPALVAIRELFAGTARAVPDDVQCQWAVCRPGPGEDLHGCDFSGQNLQRANFRDSDLSRATFTKADLRGADLRSANLSGACFTESDLRGAKLDYAITVDAIFCYTRWTDTLTLESSCGLAHDCCLLINPRGGE